MAYFSKILLFIWRTKNFWPWHFPLVCSTDCWQFFAKVDSCACIEIPSSFSDLIHSDTNTCIRFINLKSPCCVLSVTRSSIVKVLLLAKMVFELCEENQGIWMGSSVFKSFIFIWWTNSCVWGCLKFATLFKFWEKAFTFLFKSPSFSHEFLR